MDQSEEKSAEKKQTEMLENISKQITELSLIAKSMQRQIWLLVLSSGLILGSVFAIIISNVLLK